MVIHEDGLFLFYRLNWIFVRHCKVYNRSSIGPRSATDVKGAVISSCRRIRTMKFANRILFTPVIINNYYTYRNDLKFVYVVTSRVEVCVCCDITLVTQLYNLYS